MKKLLKPKDLLLLTLSGVGDLIEETRDPLHLISSSYKSVYGFMPKRYKRNNYSQMIDRSLKTGDIEKIVKDENTYLRLTSSGQKKVQRDFAINKLTKNWNKKWVVVLFDIEEKSRKTRDLLRIKLKNLGFGMFQKSSWITPLPIGKDMLELIESLGFADHIFVFEVSALVLGDPKNLAQKLWHLDRFEKEYLKLVEEIKRAKQLHENSHDRIKKREAILPFSDSQKSGYESRLKLKQKVLRKRYLEFILSLPPVPKELLPHSLQSLKPFYAF